MMMLVNILENESKMSSKSKKLKDWFVAREAQMAQLSLNDSLHSGNLARQLLDALNEAQDLEQFEANWSLKQHVEEAKDILVQMIRTAGIRDDDLITLQIVGDFSYAWDLIENFTPDMQDGVKRDPSLVGKLRATFLKLASAMERPILRISQARSKDLVLVSQYYSSELVTYVRKVLQIIPETMFRLLDQIIKLQTDVIKDVPTRLDKDKLKDFAQLNERFEVAKLTHGISVFTQGILAMKSTLYGVIKVDPKKLLEDGIRKELVRLVCNTYHQALTMNKKDSKLEMSLRNLHKIMHGLATSFQYIQDYVNISGFRIWQEELSRIMDFYVEQESNLYLNTKTLPGQSIFQSKAIPIPLLSLTDVHQGYTWIGRLLQELSNLTHWKTSIFIPARMTWYDLKSLEEIATLTNLFPLVQAAIGSHGLAGLDRLLGLRVTSLLQKIHLVMDETVFKDKAWSDLLKNLFNSLTPVDNVIGQPAKFYHQQHLHRATRALTTLIGLLADLGQHQLLRHCIAYQLSLEANFDAKLLFSSLKAYNS